MTDWPWGETLHANPPDGSRQEPTSNHRTFADLATFRELGPDARGHKGLWQAPALSLLDQNDVQVA